MIAAVLRCITVALAIAITNADGDTENQKLPPVVLNATTLPILRGSPRFAAVRFARASAAWPSATAASRPASVRSPDCSALRASAPAETESCAAAFAAACSSRTRPRAALRSAATAALA